MIRSNLTRNHLKVRLNWLLNLINVPILNWNCWNFVLGTQVNRFGLLLKIVILSVKTYARINIFPFLQSIFHHFSEYLLRLRKTHMSFSTILKARKTWEEDRNLYSFELRLFFLLRFYNNCLINLYTVHSFCTALIFNKPKRVATFNFKAIFAIFALIGPQLQFNEYNLMLQKDLTV